MTIMDAMADVVTEKMAGVVCNLLLGFDPSQLLGDDERQLHTAIKSILLPVLIDIASMNRLPEPIKARYKPQAISAVENLLLEIMATPDSEIHPRIKESASQIIRNWMTTRKDTCLRP